MQCIKYLIWFGVRTLRLLILSTTRGSGRGKNGENGGVGRRKGTKEWNFGYMHIAFKGDRRP